MKEIRLDLMDSEGNTNTYTQKRVPLKKIIEYLELENKNKETPPTSSEVVTQQVEFLADLFDDTRVTPEAIFEGLDAREFESAVRDTIFEAVGILKSDDEGK